MLSAKHLFGTHYQAVLFPYQHALFPFLEITKDSHLEHLFPCSIGTDGKIDLGRVSKEIRAWKNTLDQELTPSLKSPLRLCKLKQTAIKLFEQRKIAILKGHLKPFLHNERLVRAINKLDKKIYQLTQIPEAFTQITLQETLGISLRFKINPANGIDTPTKNRITRSNSAPAISDLLVDHSNKLPIKKRKETDPALWDEFYEKRAHIERKFEIQRVVEGLATHYTKASEKAIIKYFSESLPLEKTIVASYLDLHQAKAIFFSILVNKLHREWMKVLIFNLRLEVFTSLILGIDDYKITLLNALLKSEIPDERAETERNFKPLRKALIADCNRIFPAINRINDHLRDLNHAQDVDPGIIETIHQLQSVANLGEILTVSCQKVFKGVFDDIELQEIFFDLEIDYKKYRELLEEKDHRVEFSEGIYDASSSKDSSDGSPWTIIHRKSLHPIYQLHADEEEDDAIDYIFGEWNIHDWKDFQYTGLVPEGLIEPAITEERNQWLVNAKKMLDNIGLRKRSDLAKFNIFNKETLRRFLISRQSMACSSSKS